METEHVFPVEFVSVHFQHFDSMNILVPLPWCWNIYQHLPQKHHQKVDKYTKHGAPGTFNIAIHYHLQRDFPIKRVMFHNFP